MKKYLEIFWTFFKIGLFTFGGGYVMINIMSHTIVNKKGWLTEDKMFDLLVISESTPGPFAINGATYIGYKHAKFWGSFFATLGVILPSFIIILLISFFLETFKENLIIQNGLKGISAGVSVLILLALMRMGKKVPINLVNIILFLVALVVAFFNFFSIIYVLIAGAIFGLIYGTVRGRKDVNRTT
ncbi:MAG: chromate transporter [Acholeplasmataceae bacterium]|nr:chromate transporter [Acholeplasmataceae bacterium]